MKIATLDRVYDVNTGAKTAEAFVSFDNGDEYRGLFPDYSVGDEVFLTNGMHVLSSISDGEYKYDDEAEMALRVKKKDAEFFYKTASFLPYNTYEELRRQSRNIVFLYDRNPYVLCEKEDASGKPYAPFWKVDAVTDITSFEIRLKELRLAALYILDANESEGHTWMPYKEFDKKLRKLLERGGHPLLVGDSSAILSYFTDFFVEEPFTEESRVSKTSTRRMEYQIEKIVRMYENNDSLFRRYMPPMDTGGLTEEQKNAVSGAILSRGRFSVLTGGPGTGKTTVISAILDGMASSYPDVRIRLLAPTGRASKRMEEQMGDRDVEVSTIHKFVGYGMDFMSSDRRKSIRKSGLVIIDEASMLDLAILSMLLEELDMENTKVVLVGDEDQLPSVGAGNVLHDIIRMSVPTFRLTVNHRSAGSISKNARRIIEGRSVFSLEEDESFKIVGDGDAAFGYLLEASKLARDEALISPYHKEGKESGTHEINEVAKEHKFCVDKRVVKGQGKSMPFNLGDKVICTHTSYKSGYMNGDTGVYAGKNGELHSVRMDGGERTVLVCDGDLELGYAITIHKSQGSEYDSVAVFIPEFSPFITRKMLYTAVTRAKSRVTVYADPFTVDEVIKNNKDDERRTLLGTLIH